MASADTKPSFVHLHVHTQFSVATALTRLDDIVASCNKHGMGAVAMTDWHNLHGAKNFHDACAKGGIKPIYGASLGIAARPMGEHVLRQHQLVLLAESLAGYKNLLRLISRAQLAAPAGSEPRLDHDTLAAHAEGLIALSGNLGGEIPNALLRQQPDEAGRHLGRYRDIFGPDRFFLEVQRTGLKEADDVLPQLLELSAQHDVPAVATNDVHYLRQENARAHEVLMCIGLGILANPDPDWLPTNMLDLASPEEMRRRFAERPELCDRTLEIAARCDVSPDFKSVFLPKFPVPDGETIESYFVKVARRGLDERFAEFASVGKEVDQDAYRARLQREFDVILHMDFPGYFLIVWDFIKWAKEQGIPVGPGRGSGAGSLVAYALRITDIDPLPYNLLFERFLNPERVSMPDFDIDFCVKRRGEVIDYVADKYGSDHVGQIVTFGTLKAKAAVRDCGRALGVDLGVVNRVAKLVPDGSENLGEARKTEARLEQLAQEGAIRQTGMHAAGVVISEQPLWEYVPVSKGIAGENVTQFAKDEVEKAGLVKFDFLGLKNLTMIQHCVEIINARKGEGEPPLDIGQIPLDSPEAYAVMGRGRTAGIFQMESSGFTAMVKQLQPSEFEDIIAAGALYRPGPLKMGMHDRYIERKHGREEVTVDHESLRPILRETYGVIVYQEQVMQIAREMAGYSLGGADLLRRAMGKKKQKVMEEQAIVFADGAEANGIPRQTAEKVFGLMASFAEYGFNKSHAAAYGLVTYQTAWLKAHHPLEFYAALLTADKSDTDKVVAYIKEARADGIEVLPPDVNLSLLGFTVVEGAIRFGLGAIKGVGEGAIEAIVSARDEDGAFTTLFSFCRRVDTQKVNKRVLEQLVKCGAFDCFGEPRDVLWANLARAIELAQKDAKVRDTGQTLLFGAASDEGEDGGYTESYAKTTEPWSARQQLEFEKECLGFYVTGHPLDRYRAQLSRLGVSATTQLKDPKILRQADRRGRVPGKLACVVVSLRETRTRKGDRMAFLNVEDLSGQAEVIAFPRSYEQTAELLASDVPLLLDLTASQDRRDESRVQLILDDARALDELAMRRSSRVRLRLDPSQCGTDELSQLCELLGRHTLADAAGGQGVADLVVLVQVPDRGEVVIEAARSWRVRPDDALINDLERLLGHGRVALG
jgi:DNA polymerase-3 subunit alpha